jgi:hypothetical protein
MITVSLIDDELVDIKKENEDYENLNVVETNEINEEEPNESLNGNSSKQLFNIFSFFMSFNTKKM